MLRSPWLLAVLAIFLSVVAAQAETPTTERVQELVRQLDSDVFTERQNADESLRSLGVAAIPLLRAELAKNPSPEVERRLQAMIRELGRLTWHHELGKAMQEAKKTGKPLLVFSTIGIEDGFGSVAARAMQNETFADARVHARLPRDFVLCWHNRTEPRWEAWFLEIHAQHFPGVSLDAWVKERLRDYKEGRDAGSTVTFFCTPEGRIVYPLAGFWGPKRFLQEAEAAGKLVQASSGTEPIRYAVASRLEQLPPAPPAMDKHLKPPCEELLVLPTADRYWDGLLRPNLLPVVDEGLDLVLAKLAREAALTH